MDKDNHKSLMDSVKNVLGLTSDALPVVPIPEHDIAFKNEPNRAEQPERMNVGPSVSILPETTAAMVGGLISVMR